MVGLISVRGPIDASRVNIHEARDLTYWSRALGVSAERLVRAVDEAGAMADDVRAELRRQRTDSQAAHSRLAH